MNEEWKCINGYENLYQISNFGNIKNNKGQILKQFKNHKGYLITQLSNNGKSKTFIVHRLVAQAFIPNPENKPQINHKDTNKLNNYIDNLEWVTNSENKKHAKLNGLCKSSPKGGANKRAIKVDQYDLNNNLIKQWDCISDIIRFFKLKTGSNIISCCKGRLNTAYGYIWKYNKGEM